jgi:hypothetical protein
MPVRKRAGKRYSIREVLNMNPEPNDVAIAILIYVLCAPLVFWVWNKYADVLKNNGPMYLPRENRRKKR